VYKRQAFAALEMHVFADTIIGETFIGYPILRLAFGSELEPVGSRIRQMPLM
jgi:hypothetical protein